MTAGRRVVHPVHAFGRVEAITGPDEFTVRLDNGDIITTTPEDWDEISLPDGFMLDVGTATDEQLREELATVQKMRAYEPGKAQRTRAKKEQEGLSALADTITDAATREMVKALLATVGGKKK